MPTCKNCGSIDPEDKIWCTILEVHNLEKNHIGLLLQPVREGYAPFRYIIHNPQYEYHVGYGIFIDVRDLIIHILTLDREVSRLKSQEEMKKEMV